MHFFAPRHIQWPYANHPGGENTWARTSTTGSSAARAPLRATAEPKLLPLCADGHARRFSFCAPRGGFASAPHAGALARGSEKFGVFTEHFIQFLLIKSLTKRRRTAILQPEPEKSSSPSRGAAPLEYRFSAIDGGESDVLNRPEADRVLSFRRRHAVVRNLANACSFPAVGVRVQRETSAHGRKRKQKEVLVMEPNTAG